MYKYFKKIIVYGKSGEKRCCKSLWGREINIMFRGGVSIRDNSTRNTRME